ncbi:hypothetical protein ACFLVM_01710 [Chloroflexota bacterium]
MEVPHGVGKILDINDGPGISNDIANWLKTTGYHYTFVDNYEEAGNILKKHEFNLIIFTHELKYYCKYIGARLSLESSLYSIDLVYIYTISISPL